MRSRSEAYVEDVFAQAVSAPGHRPSAIIECGGATPLRLHAERLGYRPAEQQGQRHALQAKSGFAAIQSGVTATALHDGSTASQENAHGV
jgi:hypothetical protein